MKRRNFLKLLAAGSSTVAASSCGFKKTEKLIPYVVSPEEDIMSGVPVYFKSTCAECPAGCGLQVKAYDKVIDLEHRLCPVKLEGLEDHPANLGGLCMRGQSALTRLYHPGRVKQPMLRYGKEEFRPIGWDEAFKRLDEAMQKAEGKQHLYLAGYTTGLLNEVIDEFCNKNGVSRAPEFEPISYSAIRQANEIVFGRKEIPHYRLNEADSVVTIGADILETFLNPVDFGSQYAKALRSGHLHWLHLEPHLSLTGLSANQRIVIRPGSEASLLGYLLHQAGRQKTASIPFALFTWVPPQSLSEVANITGLKEEQIQKIEKTLFNAKRPLLIVGGSATATESGLDAAVIAAMLQFDLGMTENTVDFASSANFDRCGDQRDLKALANRLNKDEIGVLFLSRTDPVATASKKTGIQDAIGKAGFRVALSDLMTDTAKSCDLVLPLSHALESWGDVRARKDVVSLMQPALKPVFDTRMEGDILLELIARHQKKESWEDYQSFVLRKLRDEFGEAGLETLLDQGYLRNEQERIPVSILKANPLRWKSVYSESGSENDSTLIVSPSIRQYDGRGKALPLLSEIPDPLTTVTYGDWVSIGEEDAKRLGIGDQDRVRINVSEEEFELTAKIQPLLKSNVFTTQIGSVSLTDLDFDARTGESIAVLSVAKISKTGIKIAIPILAGSLKQEGRPVLPDDNPVEVGHGEHDSHAADEGHAGHGSFLDHQKEYVEKHNREDKDKFGFYPKQEYPDYRWAMSIDLDACTGCGACVAACYVENNIPLTGPEEHLKGREMSWLRIEPYYEKDSATHLPMLCQQCDNAPCEPVCPVYASYHNPEGLNGQVYNRCVGTRYCANNCPYKVRRFNWFDHPLESPLDRMLNPEVSKRMRGVMEKCTFCVQRIRSAKDHAKDEGRKVRDGEVVPACGQSCPTQAIVFGNMKDETSNVYQMSKSDRVFRVFEFLGVEPAVYYLREKKG